VGVVAAGAACQTPRVSGAEDPCSYHTDKLEKSIRNVVRDELAGNQNNGF